MDNLYVICNDIHEKKKGKRKGKNKKKSSKQNQQNNRRRITIDDLRGFGIKSYVYNRIDYKSLPTISVEIKYGRTTKSIIISYDMEKKLILVPEGIFRMYEKEIRKLFKIK